MEGPITDSAREAMLLAALARTDPRSFKDALQVVSDPRFPISKPTANALAALRKHRDPRSVLDRAQYRVAVPYAAAIYSEPCLAAVIEAFADFKAQIARDQRILYAGQAVNMGTVPAAEFKHVAKTFGCHQRTTGAAPFYDGIGGDRGAVDDEVQPVRVDIGCTERIDQPARRIVWRRGDLEDRVRGQAILGIKQVGKGPPDIDPAQSAHLPARFPNCGLIAFSATTVLASRSDCQRYCQTKVLCPRHRPWTAVAIGMTLSGPKRLV